MMRRLPARLVPPAIRAAPLYRSALIVMALLGLLSIGACGFKLRGQVEIPPELEPIYIAPQRGSPVRGEIVRQLQESQVGLAARPQDARLIVRISNESSSSRVVAVDRDGKALASEIQYRLTFDAVTPDGKQLLARQAIDVVRAYENQDVAVLGKQLESELIYRDMITDAANRVLNRLRAVLL